MFLKHSVHGQTANGIEIYSFYDELPELWKHYFEACTVEEKRSALGLLSVILKGQDFTVPNEALKTASEHGHPTAESIKHVYYQLVNGRGIRETLTLPQFPRKLPVTEGAERGLTHYDQLMALSGGELS